MLCKNNFEEVTLFWVLLIFNEVRALSDVQAESSGLSEKRKMYSDKNNPDPKFNCFVHFNIESKISRSKW